MVRPALRRLRRYLRSIGQRDLAARLDIRARRRVARVRYPWATWWQCQRLAAAEHDARDETLSLPRRAAAERRAWDIAAEIMEAAPVPGPAVDE